jgi:subtilase family serine protease
MIPSIAGNSQSAASIAYNTTGKSGPHQITVIVDPDNTIAEQSEDNNQASETSASRMQSVGDGKIHLSNGDGVKEHPILLQIEYSADREDRCGQ